MPLQRVSISSNVGTPLMVVRVRLRLNLLYPIIVVHPGK